MAIEFNTAKDLVNIEKHGHSLNEFQYLDFEKAVIYKDERYDYDEDRYIIQAKYNGRLFIGVFTPRGTNTRVISLRKANNREVRNYEKAINQQ